MTGVGPGMTCPTFLVIGAQKCGTTWLARMLSQHPEVSVAAQKELHFFDKPYNYERGLSWYRQQFSAGPVTKAVGEFTPNYFWTTEDSESGPSIPRLVHEACPDIKLVVSVRNPVDRAISAYYHHIRQGRVSPRQSLMEVAEQHGIKSMGYYDVHLGNWMRHYRRSDFLLLIYEQDLQDDCKRATIRRLFRHVGVDDAFEPAGIFSRYNVRRSDFDLRTRHYPSLVKRGLRRVVPERLKKSRMWDIVVRKEEKAMLAEAFEPHNRNLESMIGCALPWTAGPRAA